MFRSYDHLQLEIYTVEINSTDKGSVAFLLLFLFVILVDYGDRCVPGDGQ
jgi:hypothetical protein